MGGDGRVQRFGESGDVISPWEREVGVQGKRLPIARAEKQGSEKYYAIKAEIS